MTGLVFHPTYSAALDVPAVNLAKQWIRAYGDTPWGRGGSDYARETRGVE